MNEKPKTTDDAAKVVHDGVDIALVNQIAELIGTGSHSVGAIMSSLAYIFADILATRSDSHQEICALAVVYSDYIHNMAHSSFDDNDKHLSVFSMHAPN